MGNSRDSIKDIWGGRTPHADGVWPTRVDERTVEKPDKWVQSCCVLCSNGCALDIGVKGGRIVGVRGRKVDRVNRGRLGPKGLHGWEANHSPARLTRPLIRRDGRLRETTWEQAMKLVVRKTKEIQKKYTSGALGVYNTGQLFLEEYYTLSMIVHAGRGTNNMDGNTRLCTATAAQALKETFGSDGQPGSYSDLDVADCFLLAGHNMAATQTVLWSRILDRRAGQDPPKLVVIDPRETETAKEADVHLAPRVGTNVAVMNGLLNLIIEAGNIDEQFIEEHTVGFEKLREVVSDYTPGRVEELTGIPTKKLRAAARLLGSAEKLFSTVLQGFYQSHQATAASVQVNNLNLIRGMIGRPGCGLLQMNGQPKTALLQVRRCPGPQGGRAAVHGEAGRRGEQGQGQGERAGGQGHEFRARRAQPRRGLPGNTGRGEREFCGGLRSSGRASPRRGGDTDGDEEAGPVLDGSGREPAALQGQVRRARRG